MCCERRRVRGTSPDVGYTAAPPDGPAFLRVREQRWSDGRIHAEQLFSDGCYMVALDTHPLPLPGKCRHEILSLDTYFSNKDTTQDRFVSRKSSCCAGKQNRSVSSHRGAEVR